MNTAYATLLLIATAVYMLFIVVTYTMLVFVFYLSIYLSNLGHYIKIKKFFLHSRNNKLLFHYLLTFFFQSIKNRHNLAIFQAN